MKVPVVWLAPDDGTPGRGYWDQELLTDVLDGRVWRTVTPVEWVHADQVPPGGGAVVVVPGASSSPERVHQLTAHLDWMLLVVTSDEERRFDHRGLVGPRRRVWLQYPRPGVDNADGYWPVGYAPGTRDAAAGAAGVARERRWCFMGQVTHPSRVEAASVLRGVRGGMLEPTTGFGEGLPHDEYVQHLAGARCAPAPAGPCSPDSFRVWEALEAGAVPVTEGGAFWRQLLGGDPPWPVVDGGWDPLSGHIDRVCANPYGGAQPQAWWLRYRRDLAYLLRDTVHELAGLAPTADRLADKITVVIPTSPIPSNPGMHVLAATVESVRDQLGPDVEVLVTCDGVRPQQHGRRAAYAQAVQELVTRCAHHAGWEQTLPVVHRQHQHQARMLRDALRLVRTPLVLYVEHDTPMEGPIDWAGAAQACLTGTADVVRFHHESGVLDEHLPLMVGTPQLVGCTQLWATHQWSQRPHLARADYYRRVLTDHFGPDERWMIEDRMHSVLQVAWNDRGRAGWLQHRVWLYYDHGGYGGGIRRSHHLDGRGDDPKWVDQ